MEPTEHTRENEVYRVVRGWLLFLCLILTIFSPAVTFLKLFAVAVALRRSVWYFGTPTDLPGLFWTERLLEICFAAFSIYVGVALWRVRPNAVKIAKRYLLVFLAYGIIAPLFPFLTAFPAGQANPSQEGV